MKKIILFFISIIVFANFSYSAPKYLQDKKSTEPVFSGFKKVVTIPQNYKLNVELKTPININDITVFDKVELNLKSDFMYKGQLIAPEGSVIIGNVVKVNRSKKGGNSIKAKFTAIITPENQIIPISAIFDTKDNSGIIYADVNGDFLAEYNTNIIIMQPITFVPKK